MSMPKEQYIEHEVRIRIQEQNSIDLKNSIKDNATELKNSMNGLRKEVHVDVGNYDYSIWWINYNKIYLTRGNYGFGSI